MPHEEKSCGNRGKQEAYFPPFPQHGGDDGDGYLFFKNVQLKSHYLNENFFEFSEGIKWLFLNEFAENY